MKSHSFSVTQRRAHAQSKWQRFCRRSGILVLGLCSLFVCSGCRSTGQIKPTSTKDADLRYRYTQHQTAPESSRAKAVPRVAMAKASKTDIRPPLKIYQASDIFQRQHQPALYQQYPKLPKLVRPLMPLTRWLSRLPVSQSPALPQCRKRIVSRVRADAGKIWVRCTRHARYARYRSDCSGWIRCVYSHLGIDAFAPPNFRSNSGTFLLYHYILNYGTLHKGQPKPGDIVFWHGSVDRNKNGRLDDDPLTHVGLVDKVDPDGRVQLYHAGYGSKPGVIRAYMYLKDPSLWRRKLPRAQWTRKVVSKDRFITQSKLTAPKECHKEKKTYRACQRYLRKYRKGSKRYRRQLWRCNWRRRRIAKFCSIQTTRVRVSRRKVYWEKYRYYNTHLVSKRSRKYPRFGHTTAELFAGFGSLSQCPQDRLARISRR